MTRVERPRDGSDDTVDGGDGQCASSGSDAKTAPGTVVSQGGLHPQALKPDMIVPGGLGALEPVPVLVAIVSKSQVPSSLVVFSSIVF